MKPLAKFALCAGLLASCFNAAACTGPQVHNLNDMGEVSYSQLFENGPWVRHVTVEGSALQSGKHYLMNHSRLNPTIVTIKGNIPANAKIDVDGGRLIIDGDIGDGASIGTLAPRTYKTVHKGGKGGGHRYIDQGLKYPDSTAPGITVNGSIGQNVTMYSDFGVNAQCAAESAQVWSANNRPVNITVRAQFKC